MERSMSLSTAGNCEIPLSDIDSIGDEWGLMTSRYVLGHEAMKRMGSSNVLVVGLKGLGVEIGKCGPFSRVTLRPVNNLSQPRTLPSPVSNPSPSTTPPQLPSPIFPRSSSSSLKMSASPAPTSLPPESPNSTLTFRLQSMRVETLWLTWSSLSATRRLF